MTSIQQHNFQQIRFYDLFFHRDHSQAWLFNWLRFLRTFNFKILMKVLGQNYFWNDSKCDFIRRFLPFLWKWRNWPESIEILWRHEGWFLVFILDWSFWWNLYQLQSAVLHFVEEYFRTLATCDEVTCSWCCL